MDFCDNSSNSEFVSSNQPICQLETKAEPSLSIEQNSHTAACILSVAQSFPAQAKVSKARAKRQEAFKVFLARKKELKAQKRKMESNPDVTPMAQHQKRRKFTKIVSDPSKTALQKLHEVHSSIIVRCEPVPDSLLFKAEITLNGSDYSAISNSKQDAKQKVAAQVIESFAKDLDASFPQEMETFQAAQVNGDRNSLMKTPVQILNELFAPDSPKWLVDGIQSSPGQPFFATVDLGFGHGEFSGSGRSKRNARHSAAMAAVLKVFRVDSLEGLTPEHIRSFIQQFRMNKNFITSESVPKIGEAAIKIPDGDVELPPPATLPKPKPAQASVTVPKNALQLLNERYGPKKLEFSFIKEDGPPNKKVFQVKLLVEGDEEEFLANGLSKQEAKRNAAEIAAKKLSIVQPALLSTTSVQNTDKKPVHNLWSDYAADLVLSKFNTLTENSEWQRRTVLAGIIMTVGEKYEESAQTIAIATGTKCISAANLSMTGSAIIDSHAEVLCRRALCRYFYSHLMIMNNESLAENAIFEKRPDGNSGYRLKDGYQFHLYISTTPCGDGRIFSHVDEDEMLADNNDRHPNRLNRGILRQKLEAGEGTIPSIEPLQQTWDGILGGERLSVMSCSDKILTWNQLGVQGNLLSQFIEPIYFTSIIIGSSFNYDHLQRAICTRLLPLNGEQSSFKRHCPDLFTTSRPDPRVPCKPPKHALLWTVCDPNYEIINTATETEKKLSKISDSADDCSLPSATYYSVKRHNKEYCDRKKEMIKSFLDNFLGYWPVKPQEIDDFNLPPPS